MAVLTVHTREGAVVDLPVSPVVSVLNTLLQHGISIRHQCGGKTLCGTCRIQIVSGGRTASPVHERERQRLSAVSAGEEFRLACQLYASGDMTIVIPP